MSADPQPCAVDSNSTRWTGVFGRRQIKNMSKNKQQAKGRINRKRKRTARVICQNETQFWTTQAQFWQWVRELKVKKTQDNPLTGRFTVADEESLIILSNTVLNLNNRNHVNEVLASRRLMRRR